MEIAQNKRICEPYRVLLSFYAFFMLYAFYLDSPSGILHGLSLIIKSRDLLVTDYIELAGLAAALVNVSLVGIMCVALMLILRVKANGPIITALWLASGFSFLGKNIVNIWPVILGVYLFSKYQKSPFKNYALVCLLSTSLAPIVSQTAHLDHLAGFGDFFEMFVATVIGVTAGFLLPPLASFSIRVHSGYNLYNVGFAAGLLGMVYAAFARAVGIDIESSSIWGTHFTRQVALFSYTISLVLIALGAWGKGKNIWADYKKIMSHSGRLVTDYYALYGRSAYFNMGLLGIFATSVMLLLGIDLNGPTLGGVFTFIGFGAFGKHIKNTTPIMAGAILGALFNVADSSSASNALAILFSTCLAPIAGQFGWKWGLVAGFLHVTLIPSMGDLHAGLNLYNNGFGAGFVALILIPLITAFRKDESVESQD